MLKRKSRVEFEIPAGTFRVIGLAALSGVRSMAGPAFLARAIRGGDVENLSNTPFAALGSKKASVLLQTLLVGEMIGDKTSFVPARVSAPALFGRALSGALVGSALFVSRNHRGGAGALLGTLSALAGVYAADHLRKGSAQKLGIPDAVFGHLEDALVLSVGSRLLKRTRS